MPICTKCGSHLFEGQSCPSCYARKREAYSSGHSNKQSCFIATVAFGDPDCFELEVLRNFRDTRLSKSKPGRLFIAWYYRNGEQLASWIELRPNVKRLVKTVLASVVTI